jgi:hypothetical protein
MPKRKSSYSRLAPLKIGLLASHERAQRLVAERVAEKIRRLNVLRERYHVPPGDWFQLAMRLAEAHEPILQEGARPGRPTEWRAFENMVLAGEMCRELESGAPTQTAAARRLAQREPWTTFLKRRRRKKGGGSPASDGGESILAQYRKIDQPYRKIGEDAFHYDIHPNGGSLKDWEAMVGQILAPRLGTK